MQVQQEEKLMGRNPTGLGPHLPGMRAAKPVDVVEVDGVAERFKGTFSEAVERDGAELQAKLRLERDAERLAFYKRRLEAIDEVRLGGKPPKAAKTVSPSVDPLSDPARGTRIDCNQSAMAEFAAARMVGGNSVCGKIHLHTRLTAVLSKCNTRRKPAAPTYVQTSPTIHAILQDSRMLLRPERTLLMLALALVVGQPCSQRSCLLGRQDSPC